MPHLVNNRFFQSLSCLFAGVGELHFLSDFAVLRYTLGLFCRLSTAFARSCRNWQIDGRRGFLVRYVQFCERVKWL